MAPPIIILGYFREISIKGTNKRLIGGVRARGINKEKGRYLE